MPGSAAQHIIEQIDRTTTNVELLRMRDSDAECTSQVPGSSIVVTRSYNRDEPRSLRLVDPITLRAQCLQVAIRFQKLRHQNDGQRAAVLFQGALRLVDPGLNPPQLVVAGLLLAAMH